MVKAKTLIISLSIAIVLFTIVGMLVGRLAFPREKIVIANLEESSNIVNLNYDHNLGGNVLRFNEKCSIDACDGERGYAKSGTIHIVNDGLNTDMSLTCICEK